MVFGAILVAGVCGGERKAGVAWETEFETAAALLSVRGERFMTELWYVEVGLPADAGLPGRSLEVPIWVPFGVLHI